MTCPRVIIIGAGPGGSVAGFHLAGAGFDVTIVERAAFPRVKVCGEFISPAATAMLERVISPADLRRAGARRVERFVIELGDRAWSWNLPEAAWALSRSRLDTLLVRRAQDAGAVVVQPALVHGVRYGRDGVRVALADGRRLDADLVLHADGSGRHDPAGPVPCAAGLVGHKCHLHVARSDLDGVRIRAAAGGYVGTIAVEGGLATCALVARRRLVAHHRGDIDGMVAALWPAFEPGWRVGEWKSCGVARSPYVRPGHVRSFRLGNAGAAVDPIGGEGIGLAVWAGGMLARLLAEGTAARRGVGVGALAGVQEIYERRYRRRLRTRLPACRAAAEVLMRPRLCTVLWPLLGVPRLTVAPWYALTGKGLGVARVSP